MGVKCLVAIPLNDFIDKEYGGNRAAFARDYGLQRQNIKPMIDKGYVVIDGEVFRPMVRYTYGGNCIC